jgi:hypothetical protein
MIYLYIIFWQPRPMGSTSPLNNSCNDMHPLWLDPSWQPNIDNTIHLALDNACNLSMMLCMQSAYYSARFQLFNLYSSKPPIRIETISFVAAVNSHCGWWQIVGLNKRLGRWRDGLSTITQTQQEDKRSAWQTEI